VSAVTVINNDTKSAEIEFDVSRIGLANGDALVDRLGVSKDVFRRPDLNNPPTSVGGIQELGSVLECRLDLNNPPTPVGWI